MLEATNLALWTEAAILSTAFPVDTIRGRQSLPFETFVTPTPEKSLLLHMFCFFWGGWSVVQQKNQPCRWKDIALNSFRTWEILKQILHPEVLVLEAENGIVATEVPAEVPQTKIMEPIESHAEILKMKQKKKRTPFVIENDMTFKSYIIINPFAFSILLHWYILCTITSRSVSCFM